MSETESTAGGLFRMASERIGGAVAMAGPATYAIWAIIIGIVLALTLMSIDYFYPFLPLNPITGPSAMARAGKTFWKTVEADTENLMVPSDSSPTTSPGQYSVSFQFAISDSRTPSPGKFRHIVHRGSNPAGISVSKPGSSGHANIQPDDLPQPGEPTYTATGLPQIMNPGVFLDKYKNDVHIFIHTKGKEEGMDVLLLESTTVEDVPMNTPMNLGVVCNGRTLEVYLNCRLYSTMLLRGAPYLPKADNQWFGRYGAFPFTGLVKNLTLWAAPLGSSDYMQMCRGAGSSLGDMPQSCSTSNTGLFGDLKSIASGQATSAQEKGLAASVLGSFL